MDTQQTQERHEEQTIAPLTDREEEQLAEFFRAKVKVPEDEAREMAQDEVFPLWWRSVMQRVAGESPEPRKPQQQEGPTYAEMETTIRHWRLTIEAADGHLWDRLDSWLSYARAGGHVVLLERLAWAFAELEMHKLLIRAVDESVEIAAEVVSESGIEVVEQDDEAVVLRLTGAARDGWLAERADG